MGNGPGGQPRAATGVEPASWEGMLAMALLWLVPVVGFVLAMVVGGSPT